MKLSRVGLFSLGAAAALGAAFALGAGRPAPAEVGRYQISATAVGGNSQVFLLDTYSGEVWYNNNAAPGNADWLKLPMKH